MSITHLTRRTFLAAGGAAVLASRSGLLEAAETQQLAVRLDQEIGRVRPELHGHFAEHLGTCIYGGLWVGKRSPVRNIDGYHAAAIGYLKALGIPVLRWPGGCFADDYHWRDGIGPAEKRPKRVNIWWGYYTEDNSFGTHEFIGLCRLIGAQPYLAGNVGSGTPQELRDWVEYCNFPSGSTLTDERTANGSREPFNVKYWGIGNENWGCGGNMTPEEYCAQYRQFSTFAASRADSFGSERVFLIACGPSGNNADWTRKFFDTLGRRRAPQGYTMHFYSRGRDPAAKFTLDSLREQLASFANLEKAIGEQRELMDKYDPKRQIGLMVDEWGVWDRIDPEEEKRYGRLFQSITQRSAVAAALGLNAFHRQADKLVMCNIAQTVNVLHSLLLINGEKCARTTTYWVFDMLKAHHGGMSVKTETADTSPLGISVSASRNEKRLTLTLVNPKPDAALSVNCELQGGRAVSAQARILHHADFNAANDWDHPDRITPQKHAVDVSGGRLRLELPALAVVTATVELA
jgi:alpha-N-arabinofuranosidase